MSKTIEFDGPPPGIAIGQSSTLRFVLTGFNSPQSVQASGYFQGALRFDVEPGSLSFDSATGKFSFRASVVYQAEGPCGPSPGTEAGGRVVRFSESPTGTPAIIVTEQIKIEFIGIRSVPESSLCHQGFRLALGGPLKMAAPPVTGVIASDGDLSLTIIDDDGVGTNNLFTGVHYTIPPGP